MHLVPSSIRTLSKISKTRRIICFGRGKAILEKIFADEISVQNLDYIVDSNHDLWGTRFDLGRNKVEIIGITKLKEVMTDEHELFITTIWYKELYEQIEDMLGISNRAVYYLQDKQDKIALFYKRIFGRAGLKNTIMIRSGLDNSESFDYSDNARALSDFMIRNKYTDKYKIVWLVDKPEKYRRHTQKNVQFLPYITKDRGILSLLKYYYYLYTAKYLFTTDAALWMANCRKEQVRVNLWHGCGFKDRKNKFTPCGKRYDFMTVNSKRYAEIHAVEYGCDIDQMLVTGLAKQDLLFLEDDRALPELMGIPKAEKYILWLPTFRAAQKGLENLSETYSMHETGLPLIADRSKLTELDHYLQGLGICLIIKLHPLQDINRIHAEGLNNILLIKNEMLKSKDIEVNSLLTIADALISDYSSAAVDFMLLDRPIAFTLDDVNEYGSSRGFVFSPIEDYLPGSKLYTYEEMLAFISSIAAGTDPCREERHSLMPIMHKYGDGMNGQRILDTLGITH